MVIASLKIKLNIFFNLSFVKTLYFKRSVKILIFVYQKMVVRFYRAIFLDIPLFADPVRNYLTDLKHEKVLFLTAHF